MSFPRSSSTLLLLSIIVILFGCASAKTYTTDTLPEEQLHFRWGGGFTGEYQAFLLLPNGQLFHKREVLTKLPYREVEALDKKTAKALFKTYEDQGFAELDYDNPGNATYTVTHVMGTDTARMTWGGGEVRPKQEVQSFWRRAMQAFEGKTASR